MGGEASVAGKKGGVMGTTAIAKFMGLVAQGRAIEEEAAALSEKLTAMNRAATGFYDAAYEIIGEVVAEVPELKVMIGKVAEGRSGGLFVVKQLILPSPRDADFNPLDIGTFTMNCRRLRVNGCPLSAWYRWQEDRLQVSDLTIPPDTDKRVKRYKRELAKRALRGEYRTG